MGVVLVRANCSGGRDLFGLRRGYLIGGRGRLRQNIDAYVIKIVAAVTFAKRTHDATVFDVTMSIPKRRSRTSIAGTDTAK